MISSRLRPSITLMAILGIVAALYAGPSFSWDNAWVPALTGRVNDTAKVLSEAERERLSEKLRTYELETHHQIVVLTVDTLGGESIESFSLRTSNAWHLGLKGIGDGILVVLAMKERKIRIEIGVGMARFISDIQAQQIVNSEMIPEFAKGNYAAGFEHAVNSLMDSARKFVITKNVYKATSGRLQMDKYRNA